MNYHDRLYLLSYFNSKVSKVVIVVTG